MTGGWIADWDGIMVYRCVELGTRMCAYGGKDDAWYESNGEVDVSHQLICRVLFEWWKQNHWFEIPVTAGLVCGFVDMDVR